MMHRRFRDTRADNFGLSDKIHKAAQLIIHSSKSKVLSSVLGVVHEEVGFMERVGDMLAILFWGVFISRQEILNSFLDFRITPLRAIKQVLPNSAFAF